MQKIAEVTEPYQATRFNFFGNQKAYQGSVSHRSFNFIRILGYRNSFAPLITGTLIEPDGDAKTKLIITMRLRHLVFVFSCLWFSGVFLFLGIAVIQIANEPLAIITKDSLSFAIPLGMLLFGYATVILSFNFESSKSRRFITELLQAKDTSF